MGEFDLSLIEEFRSRHSLYDRNSLQFKDKLYNAGQWQEISNKLGYDVSILKDRMLQLRNRYNLEKRRMEQLRDEVPGKYHESPWPLYDSLQFLSGHIKARRRYKSILPVASLKEDSQMNDSGNDYSALGPDDSALADDGEKEEEDMHSAQPFPNGLFTVKVEDNCSDEPEQESENETENHRTGDNSHFADNPYVMTEIHSPNNEYRQQMQRQQQLQQQHIQQQHQQLLQLRQQQRLAQAAAAAQSQILPTRIIKRNNNSNNHNDLENHQMSRLSSTPLSGGGGGGGGVATGVKRHYDDYNGPAAKQPRLSPRENKYNAFGNFISSSLLDLPQKMALELVEKFTSDIVKALTMKMENAEAAAAAAASSSNEDADGGGHHNHHSQNSEQ